MPETQAPPPLPKSQPSFTRRNTTIIKLLGVGALVLVLLIPLAMERREVEETATANAYFLPQTLNISGDVQTQMLHRGIYDAAVFRAQVTLSGKFGPPISARSRST